MSFYKLKQGRSQRYAPSPVFALGRHLTRLELGQALGIGHCAALIMTEDDNCYELGQQLSSSSSSTHVTNAIRFCAVSTLSQRK